MAPVNPALVEIPQTADRKVSDAGFESYVSTVASPLQIHLEESREGTSSEAHLDVTLNRDDGTDAVESAEEQRRREEEESIALARALMAEEAMAVSYRMSVDYLLHNRDQFSEEDLAALQAAMEENEQDEEIDEEDTGDMSYELMLRLGERLGDVKTERWSQIAREKINALPTFTFTHTGLQNMDENDCAVKCLVCQFAYENDECLRRLPCGHCFHRECVDQWLASKDFCPYCRKSILEVN